MSKTPAIAIAAAAIATAALWAASISVTGQSEPWDAEGGFYFGGLLLAGLVSGAAVPKPLWAHYVGAIMGQLAYMLFFRPLGPLLGIGVLFLAMYSLILLLGALAGSRLRLALQ